MKHTVSQKIITEKIHFFLIEEKNPAMTIQINKESHMNKLNRDMNFWSITLGHIWLILYKNQI